MNEFPPAGRHKHLSFASPSHIRDIPLGSDHGVKKAAVEEEMADENLAGPAMQAQGAGTRAPLQPANSRKPLNQPQGHAELLRAEHGRAMSLLAKEKAAVEAIAQAAKLKASKAEAALLAAAEAGRQLQARQEEHDQQVCMHAAASSHAL
jgi:hypothetical protein